MRNIGKSLIVLAFVTLGAGSALAAGPGHNGPAPVVMHGNHHIAVHQPVAKRAMVEHHHRLHHRQQLSKMHHRGPVAAFAHGPAPIHR